MVPKGTFLLSQCPQTSGPFCAQYCIVSGVPAVILATASNSFTLSNRKKRQYYRKPTTCLITNNPISEKEDDGKIHPSYKFNSTKFFPTATSSPILHNFPKLVNPMSWAFMKICASILYPVPFNTISFVIRSSGMKIPYSKDRACDKEDKQGCLIIWHPSPLL